MSTKKSFNVQASKVNGFSGSVENMRNMLHGKTIEVLKQTGGHNYGPVGTQITIPVGQPIGFGGGSGSRYNSISIGNLDGKYYNNISFTAFTVVTALTEEDIKNQIKTLQAAKKKAAKDYDAQIADYNAKLDYLKESGSLEFDETEFKAYRTLQLVENEELSKIEKARLIASLIDS